MKKTTLLKMVLVAAGLSLIGFSAFGQGKNLRTQLLANEGKTFKSTEDPEFVSYDLVLREYVAKRIQKRYGVALDPKSFSGFDLLEIEALLKCKKASESIDPYVQKFRKQP